MATTTISNLPALTPASGTVVYAENSSQSGKIDVDNVSSYALTSYNGATLAGSVQTPKAAIDGLNTKIGSTTMGTTATTITGAIAEHESDISTLNSNITELTTADFLNPVAGSASLVNNNFLLIGSSTNPYNRRVYFSWTSSNKSDFTNIPTALSSVNIFVGIRDVYWLYSGGVLVKVTECYPTAGRLHFNFYNQTTWTGWGTLTPS